MTYHIHAAAIDSSGLRLSKKPRAQTDTLAEALTVATDRENHGPEGVAIVRPDGCTIYSEDEYAEAYAECENTGNWRTGA